MATFLILLYTPALHVPIFMHDSPCCPRWQPGGHLRLLPHPLHLVIIHCPANLTSWLCPPTMSTMTLLRPLSDSVFTQNCIILPPELWSGPLQILCIVAKIKYGGLSAFKSLQWFTLFGALVEQGRLSRNICRPFAQYLGIGPLLDPSVEKGHLEWSLGFCMMKNIEKSPQTGRSSINNAFGSNVFFCLFVCFEIII